MITVRIWPVPAGTSGFKLADADVVFESGPLAGLKLVGFAVWESHSGPATRAVTFPQRSYVQGNIRQSFALLRATSGDRSGHDAAVVRLRDLILQVYADATSGGR